MEDMRLLSSRGVRRLFGWAAVPDPTTLGRFLRRAGALLVPVLDELLWRVVPLRSQAVGVVRRAMLVLELGQLGVGRTAAMGDLGGHRLLDRASKSHLNHYVQDPR